MTMHGLKYVDDANIKQIKRKEKEFRRMRWGEETIHESPI